MIDRCKNCGDEIRTMIFQGSGWCSDNCRKALAVKAQVDAVLEGREKKDGAHVRRP